MPNLENGIKKLQVEISQISRDVTKKQELRRLTEISTFLKRKLKYLKVNIFLVRFLKNFFKKFFVQIFSDIGPFCNRANYKMFRRIGSKNLVILSNFTGYPNKNARQ